MRVSFNELLQDAARRHAAVGAFTAYNAETADAVLRAAAPRGDGVILMISSQALRSPVGATLAAALAGVAERSSVAVCLQLDHETDLGRIRAALESGFGAVMADGSRLPYPDNVRLVSQAVALARGRGAHVEAELGHVSGDEEVAAAAARGALTDPDQAARFARDTGADCLAVSIGNVHGRYRDPPQLDWPRLAGIREAVDIPLSLHGASGLSDADLRRVVSTGIAKVNINTELRDRYFAVLAQRGVELAQGAQLLTLAEELSEAIAQVVSGKLELLAPVDGGDSRV